MIEEKRMYH